MLKSILVVLVLSLSLFASSGKQIFDAKCTSCHNIMPPQSKTERKAVIAPPIGNILFHLGQEFKNQEDIKKHIVNFTLNPTKEKAICNSVKRFGLMPSQKGNITKEELEKVADFLTDVIVYNKNSHKQKKGCRGGSCSTKDSKKSCSSKNKGGCNTKKSHKAGCGNH
jgi:cytochrome c